MVRSFLTRAAAGLLALAALSCASGSVFQLTLEEQTSLNEAMDTPLTFIVPRERSIASWDRAREFIDRYSSMKLRSTTDSVLVSYDTPNYSADPVPAQSGLHYGYSISRSRVPEGIRIVVQCTPSVKGTGASNRTADEDNRTAGEKAADQNAHIAAYYILTGYLGCSRCIVR